jgi:hypothetical protein
LFDDIFACDKTGLDIFDMVHYKTYRNVWCVGSYSQDLWYCALYKSGLAPALKRKIPTQSMPPVFNLTYTIKHYRALLYLNTWDVSSWDQDMVTRSLLNNDVICQNEREAAPSFGEWDPSDLMMMEERMSEAIYLTVDDDDQEDDDEDYRSEDDEDEDVEDEDDNHEHISSTTDDLPPKPLEKSGLPSQDNNVGR